MPSFLFKCIPFIHPKPHPFPLSHLTAMSIKTKTRLRGVVFDMDGTLTVPVIDFSSMYKAVLGETEYRRIRQENPSGIDILHLIESWSPDEQRKANEIILDFERLGRERLQIMPGAAELCGFLDSKKIRRGLITRNVKEAVDLYHQRFEIVFSPALSREFRPYKPDPAPLLHICSTWDVQPNEVMMVGDSLKDDVACGKRAGAFTCLLDEEGRYGSADFTELDLEPDFKNDSVTDCEEAVCEPGSAPPYISIVPVEKPIRFCCPGQAVATNLCRVWWLVGYKIESIRAVVCPVELLML